MTVNTRTKTLARRLQAATGKPYATCRQQVEEWEANSRDTWDEAAYQVADAELTTITLNVATEFPAEAISHKWKNIGMGTHAAVFEQPGNIYYANTSTHLVIGYLDGYLGYTWWMNGDIRVMGNFFHNGEQVTTETLKGDPEAVSNSIREASTWLATQFAAHPDRYDDTGRPDSVQAPIFE
jgi:hypothetical protein